MVHSLVVTKKGNVILICFFLSLFISFCSYSQVAERKVPIDTGWKFHLGKLTDAENPALDDAKWRAVVVPHDWAIEGKYDKNNLSSGEGGYLPGGTGWYRKTFDVDASWLKMNVKVFFESVYMNSDVYINGVHLGNRPYGWISFYYNLAKHLKPGKNVLAVKVDNELEPSARWYHGCGIEGHVWLEVTNRIHVAPYETFIRTPTVSSKEALVNIQTKIAVPGNQQSLKIVYTIFSPDSRVAATTDTILNNSTPDTLLLTKNLLVKDPQLWNLGHPAKYNLKIDVSTNGQLLDSYTTTFGIRTIKWDKQTGFWLNDKNIKLKGVCEHKSGGPMGAGIPDAFLHWKLKLLKEMGVNAIRTAHNPQTPTFYNMCDTMGILVMDEIFDGWHKKADHDYGGRYFKDWWRRDVTDWIKRDFNHPSVIIWSIGNETGKEDIHHITELIHKYDETRPSTGGSLYEGVDVAGFNGPGEIFSFIEDFHKKNPEQPLVLTEVPHTFSTRGFYRATTWWRDPGKARMDFTPYAIKEVFTDGVKQYNSSYDNAGIRLPVRRSFDRAVSTPFIAGQFRWTGFDYLGESGWTVGGWPARLYNHGVLDLAGFPKDTYYLYKSQWTSTPMVHLLPHWTHPNLQKGTIIPVVSYSNCDEVELFLNSKSLGRKKRSDLYEFVWNVPYQPGTLTAKGYNNNNRVVASTSTTTAESPGLLSLIATNQQLQPGFEDISILTFKVTDDKGIMVPWANDPVHFHIDGPVHLQSFENGDPVDITPNQSKIRKVFYGMARGFFRATPETGDIQVTAAAIMGDSVFQTQAKIAINVARLALRGKVPSANIEIFYTTDGSLPSREKNRYSKPFSITNTTNVKALALLNGKEFMKIERTFTKGEEKTFFEPRYVVSSGSNKEAKPFNGPFDKRAAGRWQDLNDNTMYDFSEKGEVLKIIDDRKKLVGYWWYSFAKDVFENPDDIGTGEIVWINSNLIYKLALLDREAKKLILKENGKNVIVLQRERK